MQPHPDSPKATFLNLVKRFGSPQATLFSYVAVKSSTGQFCLFCSRLCINANAAADVYVRTEKVAAGRMNLAAGIEPIEELLEAIETGNVPASGGVPHLAIPDWKDPMFRLEFEPSIEEGVARQVRLPSVWINKSPILAPESLREADWELRSLDKPYDGLDELRFSIGLIGKTRIFEAIIFEAAMFDFSSVVRDEMATLKMRIVLGLDPLHASMAYKVVEKGGNIERRGALPGSVFSWETCDGHQLGTTTIPVPRSSVIQAFARYQGEALHFGWCGDPQNFQNPLRAIFSITDPDLSHLGAALEDNTKAGYARAFEAHTARLLWLLGFAVLQFDQQTSSDFVDLVAVAPNGKMAFVECTTGSLKQDKVTSLLMRVSKAKRQLAASGRPDINILPIMVTTISGNDIMHDLSAAETRGVAVLTKDNFQDLIVRTHLLPDASQLIDSVERKLIETASSGTSYG